MITILCVLKSGGVYDIEWVRKLRDGVSRNLSQEHRFVCLSDVPVPCRRIPIEHHWPGWWSKIEMFKPGLEMLGDRDAIQRTLTSLELAAG